MTPSELILAALAVLLSGALLAAALARGSAFARAAFAAATTLGCALAALGSVSVLLGAREPAPLVLPWPVPGGALAVGLDPLGAWYALVVALVGAPCGWYAASWARELPERRLRLFVAAFPTLLASLLLLAAATNALLFLAAWEAMTLAAFLLIVLRHEDRAVSAAGWLYIVANHLGSFCLVGLVVTLGAHAPSYAFADLRAPAGVAPGTLAALWLLAFSTKAGVMPLHIWLPHAHPAAPVPVSAVLSGLVIKAGIFGLLRFLPSVSPLPPATAGVVLALGAASGVLGVLHALAQHDLKRLLAYHSVENIGIILLGIGAGLCGLQSEMPLVAAFGFAGALLHVLNHAVFKALLFLGAGSVVHAAGTAEVDRLGGLARALPASAALFLIGCAAISGLPPLNGFVSEWLVLRGLFGSAAPGQGAIGLCAAGAVLSLALIGGLALACFAKAFGAVFLGLPRDPAVARNVREGIARNVREGIARHAREAVARNVREGGARHAREATAVELLAMAWLAALCLLVGMLPHVALRLVWPAALQACGPRAAAAAGLEPRDQALAHVSLVALSLAGVVASLLLLRRRLAKGASRAEPTWGCGYSSPSSALQYTASSFAAPLLGVFKKLLSSRKHARAVEGPFPEGPSVHTTPRDGAEAWGFRPLHAMLVSSCQLVRRAQRGPVQVQILFVMIVLALILLWKVGT